MKEALGDYFKADVTLQPGTEVMDMFTSFKEVLQTPLEVKIYYRSLFDLWKYGWVKKGNTLWKVENKNLTLTNIEQTTEDELPSYTVTLTSAPLATLQNEPTPDERTYSILKSFLKLNKLWAIGKFTKGIGLLALTIKKGTYPLWT